MCIRSDGHSAAVHQRRYYSVATFSVAAAPLLFFVTSEKRQRRFFLAEKAAALQRCFLSKFSAATANKLLPRLFQLTFSHVLFGVYTLRLFSLCPCYHVISV